MRRSSNSVFAVRRRIVTMVFTTHREEAMAQFKTVVRLPVAPKALYKAWLSSREHSAMTGSKAKASPRKGGRFTAWDGCVTTNFP